MKAACLMPSIRPQMCKTFLETLAANPQPVDEVHVVAQRGTRELWEEAVDVPGVKVVLTWYESGGFVYPIRWNHAASQPDVDVWIVVDDDIEVQPETHWSPMIEGVHSGEYGVVSGGWARTPGMKARFYPPRSGEWITQPFTVTGGGMAVPSRLVPHLVAPLNEGVGMNTWLFDDIQVGLTSYLLGEQPARYRGSFAVHRILAGGGLAGPSGLYAEATHEKPDSRWINVRPCKPTYKNGNDYYMPNPADITAEAKARHKQMKSSK